MTGYKQARQDILQNPCPYFLTKNSTVFHCEKGGINKNGRVALLESSPILFLRSVDKSHRRS